MIMKLIAPLLLLLLMFAGTASATDYYVATWGDNTTQGNFTHPWQNVSYATQQAVAGDTIHLFNGTWYDEPESTFVTSGNATHPITVTAYNGTATIDGINGEVNVDRAFNIYQKDYINITNLTFSRCWYAVYARQTNNTHILNCTAYTYAIGATTGKGFYLLDDAHHCSIENCTVIGDAHNSYAVSGRAYSAGSWIYEPCTYNTIKYCKAYNNSAHGFYDLAGNQSYTYVENNIGGNNSGSALYFHVGIPHHVFVTNNTFYESATGITGTSAGTNYSRTHNVTIRDNLIYDCDEGIKLYEADNMVVENNTIYNISAGNAIYIGGYDNLYVDNTISNVTGAYYHYRIRDAYYGALNNTIRNEQNTTYRIYSAASANTMVEYLDGKVFTEDGTGSPEWHPSKSNYTVQNGVIVTITNYLISLHPVNSYLKDITMNHASDASDDRTNITANSTVSSNNAWINATMQNVSANYSVSVDGAVVDYIDADSSGVARYQYTSSWSPHDFEFNWVSAAPFSADHAKAYYNSTSTILNTVNSTGYYVWGRTITSNDIEISSGSLKVTT